MYHPDTLSKMAEVKREETQRRLADPTIAESGYADPASARSGIIRIALAAVRRLATAASRNQTATGERGV